MHMTDILNADLLEATRLTNAGRLTEATAALRRMLGGGHAARGVLPAAETSAARCTPPTLDGVAEPAGMAQAKPAPQPGPAAVPGAGAGRLPFGPAAGVGPAVSEALRGFLDHVSHGGLQLPSGGLGVLSPAAPRVPVPDGAQFLAATFSNEAGTRPYKLYMPSGYHPGRPIPLIVMLHGCTQSPDDFAAGTRMNEAAEEHTCLVVYPGQTASANMQKCWNWFSAADQHRGQGEPSLIAGITRQVMRGYAVDPRRVYVAGLSAGGAAAAIMGDAYPDLFAAIGVHSGLACRAAHDMQSAFAAMQGGGVVGTAVAQSGGQRRIVPAIVFHGDRDGTVNSRNADAVVAQLAQATALSKSVEQGRATGGHAYSRTLNTDAAGRTVIEQWVVHGAGHAWFGGSAAGSYTDPRGPDATREMLRFFLEHPHPAPAQAA
jgi:poly(hydroxyalkanoate) depolymerase family esterase